MDANLEKAAGVHERDNQKYLGAVFGFLGLIRGPRGHHAERSGCIHGVVNAMEALEVESTHVGGRENRARRDKEQA